MLHWLDPAAPMEVAVAWWPVRGMAAASPEDVAKFHGCPQGPAVLEPGCSSHSGTTQSSPRFGGGAQ